MVNFCHKFVPRLADIAGPSQCLAQKGMRFVWGPEQQKFFEALKWTFSQPPVLGMADFSEKFVLQIDASDFNLGAGVVPGI